MMEIHGTIKNASRHHDGAISGQIYGDAKGRFKDGEFVTTSKILEEMPGNIVRTRNSTYRVEWQR